VRTWIQRRTTKQSWGKPNRAKIENTRWICAGRQHQEHRQTLWRPSPRLPSIRPATRGDISIPRARAVFPKGAALSSKRFARRHARPRCAGRTIFWGPKDISRLSRCPGPTLWRVSIALYGPGWRGFAAVSSNRFERRPKALDLVEHFGVPFGHHLRRSGLRCFARLVNSNPEPARLMSVRSVAVSQRPSALRSPATPCGKFGRAGPVCRVADAFPPGTTEWLRHGGELGGRWP